MENAKGDSKKEMNSSDVEKNRENEEKTMDHHRNVNRRLIELNIQLIQRIKTLENEGENRIEDERRMVNTEDGDPTVDVEESDDDSSGEDEGMDGEEEKPQKTREIALLESNAEIWRAVAVIQAIFFFFMLYNYL